MHRRSTPARATLLISVVTAAALGLAGCTADPDENGAAVTGIIPAPASFALTGGEPFTLTAESRLVAAGEGAAAVAETFAAPARAATGFALPVVEGEAGASDIALVIADGATDGDERGVHARERGRRRAHRRRHGRRAVLGHAIAAAPAAGRDRAIG